MTTLTFLSWNVNGLRACVRNGFVKIVKKLKPDVLALQETKVQESQIPEEIKELKDYEIVWGFAKKPGYSGVATLINKKLINHLVSKRIGFGVKRFDDEGRTIITDFDFGKVKFSLYNVYFPNGKMSDERLKYKLDFYDALLKHLKQRMKSGVNIIVCGDFNTAHKEIDLKNPKPNSKYSGFLPIEREWLDKYLNSGFVDAYRYFYPKKIEYSWWSYRFNARAKNIGWRIDYFFVDNRLLKHLKDSFILTNIYGSDHCPVGIKLEF